MPVKSENPSGWPKRWFWEFFSSFSLKAHNYYPAYHIGPDFSSWKVPALWNSVYKTYKKAAGRVNLLRRIRSYTDTLSAERIYRAMIMPIFTYCRRSNYAWLVRDTKVPNKKPGTTKSQDYSEKLKMSKLWTPFILNWKFFKEKGLFICFWLPKRQCL